MHDINKVLKPEENRFLIIICEKYKPGNANIIHRIQNFKLLTNAISDYLQLLTVILAWAFGYKPTVL